MPKPQIELTDEIKHLAKSGKPGWITLQREYELITPLFGGGVAPGENDPITPVRGAEIRGHLRFWWRATRSGGLATIDALRAAEEEIWGSASKPSPVSLVVSQQSRGSAISSVTISTQQGQRNVDYGAPQSPYGYVAFPLRDREGSVLQGVSYTLQLTFPEDVAEDIRAALWAWETFGGLGARTRRGFGAVHCKSVHVVAGKEKPEEWLWQYSCTDAETEILEDLKRRLSSGEFRQDVPHLSLNPQHLKVKKPAASDPIAIWRGLFDALKRFRQSRFASARTGRPAQGRSHWPEPDAIRDLTGQSLPNHSTPTYSPRIMKFPRAEFGLPIIFEFKREDSHPSRPDKDPKKTSLEGVEHDRLASPLILRPLACANGQYVGIALILQTERTPPGGLALKNAQTKAPIASGLDSHLDPVTGEPTQIQANHPDYNGNADILQAFLDTL